MYTGPPSKDGELKEELGKISSSSFEGTSVEVPSEVGTHLGDNADKLDDKDYADPSIAKPIPKPSWSLSDGYGLLEWLSTWRNRDASTSRWQGACVDVLQENQSFTGRLTEGKTRKSEDTTTTREQEGKAYPSQEKTAKKKSTGKIICRLMPHSQQQNENQQRKSVRLNFT